MPRYRYTATALSGKTLHGVTEAASAEALYITLREQDLYMTDAKEVGTNASVYRPLKTPELAEFCRGLAHCFRRACRWCARFASWRTSAA